MARRTALINQIRAFLLERGIVFAKSPIRLREALPEVLENVNENLTLRMRNLVAMLLPIRKTRLGHLNIRNAAYGKLNAYLITLPFSGA
jgi:hypothetical protein